MKNRNLLMTFLVLFYGFNLLSEEINTIESFKNQCIYLIENRSQFSEFDVKMAEINVNFLEKEQNLSNTISYYKSIAQLHNIPAHEIFNSFIEEITDELASSMDPIEKTMREELNNFFKAMNLATDAEQEELIKSFSLRFKEICTYLNNQNS
jgi:hypothetical protein